MEPLRFEGHVFRVNRRRSAVLGRLWGSLTTGVVSSTLTRQGSRFTQRSMPMVCSSSVAHLQDGWRRDLPQGIHELQSSRRRQDHLFRASFASLASLSACTLANFDEPTNVVLFHVNVEAFSPDRDLGSRQLDLIGTRFGVAAALAARTVGPVCVQW